MGTIPVREPAPETTDPPSDIEAESEDPVETELPDDAEKPEKEPQLNEGEKVEVIDPDEE